MNFSGIPDNSFLGQLLRYLLKLIPPRTIMPIWQGTLKGKKWIVGSCTHGCWLGSFEYKKGIIFEKKINKGTIVLDLGANVGYYSLLASILVGPRGMVFSFEPLPRNIYFLKKHIQLNNIKNVRVIEAAVSDCDGFANFYVEGSDRYSSSKGYISLNGKLIVKKVSLDRLYNKGDIPIPDYIKIDVEGGEMLVLLGAKEILSNFHPIIFLATHSELIHSQCCDFLVSLGYEVEAIDKENNINFGEIIAYSR
jgi:FkbM family methyltransferase